MSDINSVNLLIPEQTKTLPPTDRWTHFLNGLQPSPEIVVLLLAIVIGGSTGMGVVTFHYLIHLIHTLTIENLMGIIAPWGTWTLAIIPTLGGLIIGLMRLVFPDFGPNMSSMIASIQGKTDLLPLRPVTKMIAASVSLGTGASLGPEGPSVEIGANFGMLLAKILQVSTERKQLLLGAGVAAGLSAGFNAPIAGVFFALEIVLGTTFATSAVSIVLLSAVVSGLIAQIGLGSKPAFALPVYEVRSLLELPLYLGLGLLASLISLAYTQLIQWVNACFRGEIKGFTWLAKIPRSIHPVMGGACVGISALFFPQIMGIGYETVEAMLQDVAFPLRLLVFLLLVKLIMTAISLGSGLVGGIFAPAMFLGASLGSIYGKVLALLIPVSIIPIAGAPAYAMVGMAAVLAGSARAPLTAILLLFELTRDYRIVLPLMAAVGLSIWVVERFKPRETKTPNPQQVGLNLGIEQNSDILNQIVVAEAMYKPALILNDSMGMIEAALNLTKAHSRSALVVNDAQELIGIITLQDLNRSLNSWQDKNLQKNEQNAQNLGNICTKDLLYAYEDEPLTEALNRMSARGLHQLPVIARENPQKVIGILEQEEISLACSIVGTRKAMSRYVVNAN
jgi:H+/Cl- antiporter ClcA/predicted transcriptional regulator